MKIQHCNQYFLSITLLAFLLTACGEDKLSPLSHSDAVLAFGDSLTIGVGVTQNHSYPSVLEKLSGRTVVNAGISGETTEEGLLRFDQTLEAAQPALVILLEGGNDILRNMSSAKTKNNLAQMIITAKEYGAEVVLIGVPEKSLFSDAHPMYAELARQHDVILIDDIISSLLKKPKYKSDSVHFNVAGYRQLAKTVYEVLRDNGAL